MNDFNPNDNVSALKPREDRKDSLFDHNLLALVFVMGLLVFALLSCADVSNTPQTPVGVPTPVTTKPNIRLVVSATALPEPNRYLVKLDWGGMSGAGTTLYRKDKAGTIQELATLDPKSTHFEDLKVSAGESYKYLLFTGTDDKTAVQAVASIVVPKDYVLDRQMPFKNLGNVNRLAA